MAASHVELVAGAIFDASGEATAITRPCPLGQTWQITRLSVFTSSTTPTSAVVYRNSVQPSNLLDGTERGNGDTTDTVMVLVTADRLVVQWTGGTPGAQASFTISGTAT